MTRPILIGRPSPAAIEFIRNLSGKTVEGGTLVWPDALELRAASDALLESDWDVLVVNPDDEPLSTAAMGHRSQIHGVPDFVVIFAAGERPEIDVSTMVLRHLPEVPVLVVGPQADSVTAGLNDVAIDLELSIRAVQDAGELLHVVAELGSHSLSPQNES